MANTFPFNSIVKTWTNDDYDSYVISTIKDSEGRGRIVGMENIGDPGSCQKLWIEECVNAGCEVIVAASRSYGQTVVDAYDLARANGYEVIEVSTHFHYDDPALPNGLDIRDAFAENMKNYIVKCLK